MIFNLFSIKKKGESGKKSTKICFPYYAGGDYPDLDSAVRALQAGKSSLRYHLDDIVQYNVRYRDYLHEHGNEALVELMLSEAPTLKDSPDDVEYLRCWLKDKLKAVATYDIQCYNINDTFSVFGKEIHGLEQLRKSAEVSLYESSSKPNVSRSSKSSDTIEGLYVGEMYMSYPKFDSYDWGDDRTYQNYIIRNRPISDGEMLKLHSLPSGMNYIRVHEHIPESMLPMVYYSGDGNYMLVATKKEE